MQRRHMILSSILLVALFTQMGTIAAAQEREISLFDKEGEAVAYIAVDDEATIYLWSGTPVAYIKQRSDVIHVYNFDGRHLGWLDQGILIDHNGDGVGFIKGALSMPTQIEPFKGFKQFKPLRGLEEIAPLRPMRSGYWSRTPLAIFLSV